MERMTKQQFREALHRAGDMELEELEAFRDAIKRQFPISSQQRSATTAPDQRGFYLGTEQLVPR